MSKRAAGWILVAVALLGCPDRTPHPTDHEVIQQLAVEWRSRWPQATGSAEQHLQEAEQALRGEELPRAIASAEMALALDPDDPAALLLLASALSIDGAPPPTARSIVEVVAQTDPLAPGLAAAQAWLAVAEGRPEAAAAAPGFLGAWAALRAAVALHRDPLQPALSLLEQVPGHQEACLLAARRLQLSGQPAAALRTIEGCQRSGAATPLDRVAADALDRMGFFPQAAERYARAGATTHAAAVRIQEGLGGPITLEAGLPDSELHRLWWGLITGDDAVVSAAVVALEASDVWGPEFAIARAAAALAAGQPRAALAHLDALDSVPALVLQARAHLALGRPSAALAAVQAARAAQPWDVRLSLLHARILRETEPAAAAALLDEVLATDPLTVALYVDHRRRQAPWSGLVPSDWLVEGLAPAQRDAIAALRSPVQRDALLSPEATLAHRGPAPSDPLAAAAHAALGAIAADRLAEGIASLEALSAQHPDAVGLQRILYEAQRVPSPP